MNLTLAILVLCTVSARVLGGRKAVKIVEEPANYGGLQAQQPNSQNSPKAMLRPFKKPQNFSGPKHLAKLYGKCFSLTDNSYLYQLCPFSNITQHEQTWRWNAFQGILGIWKEWSIVNNTLKAMVMSDGDPCPGDIRRQSKVFLKCANKNKLVSVKEPHTCQYEVQFETPLACPVDAFLVYPLLSKELQTEWEEMEKSFYHQELTMQGYHKSRRKLFTRAGLLVPAEQNVKRNVKGFSQNERSKDTITTGFKSKDECSKAYADLLHKYQQLVKLDKNSTSDHAFNNSQISITPSYDVTRARGDHGTIS